MSNKGVDLPNDNRHSRSMAVSPLTDLFNGIGYTEFWPFDFEITSLFASLATAASAEVEIDILVNGVSIFDTTLTIDAGENDNINAATPYEIAEGKNIINKGDKLDIDVISNGGDGEGLIMTFRGYEVL